ncbi:unnamed protein product [Trypanosoma congolense IL3000]|uniref:Autophagy-related protein 101 n=1 Tax=Trypanosoma congolense (strain IL3000) TaxID=1068625 RepID=F9WGQ9_TRYCI|nr:conserved hypothetical protein [Trypanosoma congolense IL3000]CCD16496.1 unnamed protein product [Trypanosoma congolense IL3000]
MHTFYTVRYPPPKGNADCQPIRVTDKAMESMLFCIVHTIEFQCPVQCQSIRPTSSRRTALPFGKEGGDGSKDEKRNTDAPEKYVCPVENTSSLLGNVTYVACAEHNPSVLASLQVAVDEARAIAIPEGKQYVSFELCVRLRHSQRRWLWDESRPLVEWVFRMVKTREKLSPPAAFDNCSWKQQRPQGAEMGTPAAHRCSEGSRTTTDEGAVCSNDPTQIRDVLQFILKHSYDSIDLNTFSDFKSGELVFDIFVRKI